jgi:hypothetical protein
LHFYRPDADQPESKSQIRLKDLQRPMPTIARHVRKPYVERRQNWSMCQENQGYAIAMSQFVGIMLDGMLFPLEWFVVFQAFVQETEPETAWANFTIGSCRQESRK